MQQKVYTMCSVGAVPCVAAYMHFAVVTSSKVQEVVTCGRCPSPVALRSGLNSNALVQLHLLKAHITRE